MAYSPYYIDEHYDGDPGNVTSEEGEGVYLMEDGYYAGSIGQYYDVNPNTGQSGRWYFSGSSATPGWIDLTEPLYYTISNPDGSTFDVLMNRNRHGLYAPDTFLSDNNQRIVFNTNPNTGEEGKWIWLGTMGWVNTEGDPQPEPEPGTIVFGGGGNMVGPYDPDYDDGSSSDTSSSTASSADSSTNTGGDDTTSTTGDTTTTDAGVSSGESGGGMMGGGGYQGGVQGLDYSSPSLPPVQATPKIDYVKMLNGMLASDVVGGMMTGRGY